MNHTQSKSTLLIPMAGAGQRFVDAGYSVPKPLIKVSGLPMIIQAARAVPETETQVFVCRSEHLKEYPLEQTIKSYFPNAKCTSVDRLTDGQASTCLLAKPHIDPNSQLHVAACDNSMVYHRNQFATLFEKADCDAVVWTFRRNPTVVFAPKAYGWVKTSDTQDMIEVSCKVPISNNPIMDHAIVGAFSFKKAHYLFDAIEQMIQENARVNNEFYVDHAMNFVKKTGLNVKVFEVDHYICWGTPNDLKTFEYWQKFFDQDPIHPYKVAKDPTYGQ
jgi:dTDP-glucose pyrophosphorylase